MKTTMTVNEARQLLEKIEARILGELMEFEQASGLSVHSVAVRRVDTSDNVSGLRSVLGDLRIEATL